MEKNKGREKRKKMTFKGRTTKGEANSCDECIWIE